MTDNKQVAVVLDELQLEVVESYSNYNISHGMTRHYIAKVIYKDELAFIKIPMSDVLKPKIKAEAEWSRFINAQLPAQQQHIRCPRVIAVTDDFLLSEYIDAPLLDDENSDIITEHQTDSMIKILKLILDLPNNKFDVMQKQNWSREIITRSVEDHGSDMLDLNILNSDDLERAINIVAKSIDQAELGLSHGDMGPWQVFDASSGLVLFDGEHSSANLPRLKDTANAFMRMFTKHQNSQGLGALLTSIQNHLTLNDEQFAAELLPVLTKWSIIGLHDAYRDSEFGEATTRRNKARQLFELCLDEDLQALKSI